MNNPQQTTNPNRIIKRSQFRELTGISRTAEWRLSKSGKLPKTVIIGDRVLGYLESDYNEWLKANAA